MTKEYDQLIADMAAGLAEDEYWCIGHAEGILEQTASKDVTFPVLVFCEAIGLDWDEAREQGYFLARATVPAAA